MSPKIFKTLDEERRYIYTEHGVVKKWDEGAYFRVFTNKDHASTQTENRSSKKFKDRGSCTEDDSWEATIRKAQRLRNKSIEDFYKKESYINFSNYVFRFRPPQNFVNNLKKNSNARSVLNSYTKMI